MLTTSGLVIACGISRTFSAIKLCTAFKASAVPCTKHTRSVVPVGQGRDRPYLTERENGGPGSGHTISLGKLAWAPQVMVGRWQSEWNPCFIISTSLPVPQYNPRGWKNDGLAMPTAALGRGVRAQLPLPSPCWLLVALATIHSLPPSRSGRAQACNGCHSN